MDTITIIKIVLIVSLFFSLFVFLRIILTSSRTGKKADYKFSELLNRKFNQGLIHDKEDITILANSVAREFGTGYNLVILLENYLKYLTENNSEKTIEGKYKLIRKIIEIEEEEQPFSSLPEEEGRLLRNINDSIKHNDIEAIDFNMNEFKSLIIVRHKSYSKALNVNKWSVPLAIIGIIFSIFFGIFSLTKSVDYDKINEIISKNKSNMFSEDSSKVKLDTK